MQEAAQRAIVAKVSAYFETLPENEQVALEREALLASPLATGRVGPALKKAIVQNFIAELLEKK